MKHKSIGQQRRRRNSFIKTTVLCCVVMIITIVIIALLLNIYRIQHENNISIDSTTLSSDLPDITTSVVEPYVTNGVTPTETPTPTPIPTPPVLNSLDGYDPGSIIDDELIDIDNLEQYFTISEIQQNDSVYQRIYGQSYVENSDIVLSELRYLKMLHVNFEGQYQVGEMIVNASVAQQVIDIFEQLCAERYEIYSMYLIDDFWVGNGTDSDSNSIEYNNTSSFCYRSATGSSNISLHALGLAIDINPQQNPYVRINSDGSLHYSHENASDYVSNRSSDIPHVITEEDYAYQLFTSYGWTWGGNWSNPKDYQHFQLG